MDLGLNGKRAIVTGGTRGIGRAIAETLASEGAHVAICARKAAEVEEAVAALKAKGVNAVGAAVDVADGAALKDWIGTAAGQLGGLDIFVSNVSGGGGRADEGAWKANFEVDLMGTVRGVEAALPHMKAAGGGSILAISTTAALEAFMGVSSYNALKAALINYVKNLSQVVAKDQITANCVSPGPIYIEGGAWNFIKDHMKPVHDATLAQIPMGRMGSAQDVANAAVFLVSPAAKYVTGTNVVVDGGFTKRVQY